MLLKDHIIQLHEINGLQKQYLELQISRARVVLEHEELKKKKTELELQKAEELKQIEIDKQRRLAALEIEAKERQLNLFQNE